MVMVDVLTRGTAFERAFTFVFGLCGRYTPCTLYYTLPITHLPRDRLRDTACHHGRGLHATPFATPPFAG